MQLEGEWPGGARPWGNEVTSGGAKVNGSQLRSSHREGKRVSRY